MLPQAPALSGVALALCLAIVTHQKGHSEVESAAFRHCALTFHPVFWLLDPAASAAPSGSRRVLCHKPNHRHKHFGRPHSLLLASSAIMPSRSYPWSGKNNRSQHNLVGTTAAEDAGQSGQQPSVPGSAVTNPPSAGGSAAANPPSASPNPTFSSSESFQHDTSNNRSSHQQPPPPPPHLVSIYGQSCRPSCLLLTSFCYSCSTPTVSRGQHLTRARHGSTITLTRSRAPNPNAIPKSPP